MSGIDPRNRICSLKAQTVSKDWSCPDDTISGRRHLIGHKGFESQWSERLVVMATRVSLGEFTWLFGYYRIFADDA